MRILADTNVPDEHVSALRGDGHEVRYTREVPSLGPEAPDGAITAYAEKERLAVLSTDVKDFAGRKAPVPILVATQAMTGGEVRTAIARLEALPFDPSETDPIWLSGI